MITFKRFILLSQSAISRDAETYEHANNVCVKCLLAGVKFEPNFTLFWVKSELCRDLTLFGVIFLAHFRHDMWHVTCDKWGVNIL